MNIFSKRDRTETTESQFFSLCEWEDCTAPQGGALYVHDNDNTILTVENSFFLRCNASSTRGGGIYALKIAECIVRHTSFVQCTAAAATNFGGGGIQFETIETQPMVDNCSFQNCSSGNDGGALCLYSAKTERQKECIINSFFDNCRCNGTANGNGGAIRHWSCIDQVIISNCMFCNCYSMCGGGAVCQQINESNNGILFYYCFFHNNICLKGGHDIVLHNSSINNIDSSCCSTRQTNNRVSIRFDSIVDKSEWLRNEGGRIRYVRSKQNQENARDAFACGINESHPCCTVSHCLTQMIPGVVKDIEMLAGTIVETRSVDCGVNAFTICGQSDSSTMMQTEFEASELSLFSVSAGTLTVRDFVLVYDSVHLNNRGSRLFEITGAGEMHISGLNISTGSGQSSETAFSTELINVQSGMFQMDHVKWKGMASTVSLFSLSSTNEVSLMLSECTFDGIERTTSGSAVMSFSNDKANIHLDSCTFEGCGSTSSENGGSMMLCAGEVNEVNVESGTFDECFCSALNGLGGGILLRLMNDNPDFLISSSFGTNTAKWGRDIFVLSPNLEMTAKSKKISCVTASSDTADKVRGYDNGNNSLAIPLCIYLLPSPSEIYVNNIEASDHSHCGIIQFPCLTMKHSLTRLTGTKKVVVSGMISMSDELALGEQKHEIHGNDDQSGWTVSDASSTSNSVMVTTNVETELSKLIFSIPPSLSSHSTFISSFSQLTLSHCSLSLQNPSLELTFLSLSVESGILTIDSFSASSITLSGNPLISLSGSITKAELISTQWLNMTNCNFTEIERAAGSGGCVSIDNNNDKNSNGEINIEECEFDGCSVLADESRGGAINAQLKGNTQLNVISCTFTGCTAPAEEEKTGFGGGMALKLIDDYSSFVISSPVFDSEKSNIARYGNDLFVEALNLTKSITNDSLPFVTENLDDISFNSMRGFDGNDTENAIPLVYFWRAIGSEIFIRDDGKDMGACGFSDCPCLSIDYSLDRLTEGNEKNINIIGKGVLQKSVDLSGISISSNNKDMCSLECHSSLEGAEGAAMKIQRITNFELINFVVPSSFASGVNVLLHIGSSEGLLTLKDCSFSENEESREEEMINFGLIDAGEGTVVLEFVAIQSLCFSKDIISVLSTTILNIKNLTMKNVVLEGASGLRISKSSGREKNEVEQDVVIEWSIFEEVTQNTTNDIPIIRNDNDMSLKILIRNTTMKRCGGLKCEKGGGMFYALNEGGSLDCSFCTISECFCSSTGRGGWLFLECTSTVEQPLNFVLSNITFKDNSAFRGRDVYVKCNSIEAQIVEEQFMLDFGLPFVKELAIWGCTTDSFVGEEDLLLRVMKYQSETIFVSAVSENHSGFKSCGEFSMPCESLNVGVNHIIPSRYSQLLVSEETVINEECSVQNVIVRSLESPLFALVYMNSTISCDEGNVITTTGIVRVERLKFNFGQPFSYSSSSIIHETNGQLSLSFVDFSSVGQSENIESVVLNSTLLNIENGILHVDNCTISFLSFKKPSFLLNGDEMNITNMKLEQIESTTNVFEIGSCRNIVFNGVYADGIKLSGGCVISINGSTSGSVSIGSSSFNNCSRYSEGASVLWASSISAHLEFSNCSCSDCISLSKKGSVAEVCDMKDVSMHICEIEGVLMKESESESSNAFEGICKWNGSLVHSANSSLVMKDVIISNAPQGGLSLSSGNVKIEKGEFLNNNPFNGKYPSLRRNIICSDSASLTISSLKGGDGVKDNSSLWILNDGCALGGIASERASPFFFPVLESVKGKEATGEMELIIYGKLLLPCDLWVKISMKNGDIEHSHTNIIEDDGFISENEVHSTISSELLKVMENKTEVSIFILFGKNKSSSSNGIVVINKSVSESKGGGTVDEGDGNINKGGRNNEWSAIVIVIIAVLFLIFIFVFVMVVVLLRKKMSEMIEKIEEIGLKEGAMKNKPERRKEKSRESFEMDGMPSTLLEGMTSQIPLLIDNDEEDETESPSTTNDETLNENEMSVYEFPSPRFEDVCVSGMPHSHSLNVISAKKPFREKEKRNIKTLYSTIHSIQGNFTLGTRAMDVVDGKVVVLAVAELFEHLISIGDERVEMIGKQLCPYSIFVEEGNNEIFVLAEELEDEKQKEEMKRWKAPEAGNEDEEIEKAVIFTLGLILHEMTTGEVPLSECNAEEAQEMMRDGVRPLTEGIEGEELVEVMEKMWADEPGGRPSLDEVIRFLNELDESL